MLTVLYQSYLNRFDTSKSEVDGATAMVAKQTAAVMSWVDSQSYTIPHPSEPSFKLFYHNQYVARIIEGCNAISVMILFVAFVIAFTGKFKNTVLFLLFGIFLIHVLNIARIALLTIAGYHYPQFEGFLHDLIFPLVIYGIVFLLWVIWVNKYSYHAAKN